MSDLTTVTPAWVIPINSEEFFIETTESEVFNKEYFLLSNTPNRQYELHFIGLTDEKYAELLAQYRGVSGTYEPFYWKSISPNFYMYFQDDVNYDANDVSMYGRWISEMERKVHARSWDVKIIFEEEKR
jgi:hypothetical protein